MPILLIAGLILFIAAIYLVSIYNGLVGLRNQVKNAFSQIDVQLKRRHDLIPNLVETVKGYMAHERQTLEAVIAARNQAEGLRQSISQNPSDGASMQKLSAAEGQLTSALGRIFALSESYPELKADRGMVSLQEELSSTENRVSFARQAFNDSVMAYNTSCEVFPNNFIAGPFGFKTAAMYEIEAVAQREVPTVKF